MAKRLGKTTCKQYEELLTFLKNNKILISGKTKPTQSKRINNLWNDFANHINSLGYGPQKTSEQWRHVFNEWKTNTRRKSRNLHREMAATGGGSPAEKKLTDLEEQLLSFLSKIHLGDTEISDSLPIDKSVRQSAIIEHDAYSDEISMGKSAGPSTSIGSVLDISSGVLINVDHVGNKSFMMDSRSDIDNEHKGTIVTIREDTGNSAQASCATSTEEIEITFGNSRGSKCRDTMKENTNCPRKSRNILQQATQTYADAQKLSLETEKAKADGVSKLADSLAAYTNVSRATLKLEYFKVFGSYEGFENLFI